MAWATRTIKQMGPYLTTDIWMKCNQTFTIGSPLRIGKYMKSDRGLDCRQKDRQISALGAVDDTQQRVDLISVLVFFSPDQGPLRRPV